MKPNLYTVDGNNFINLNLVFAVKLDTSGTGAEVRLVTDGGMAHRIRCKNDKEARDVFHQIWEQWTGSGYTGRA